MTNLTLAFTGDILPVRRLESASPPARSSAQGLFDLLESSDVAVGNFEMPLTQRGAPLEKLLNIRADPDISADLTSLGVDVLTVANNHCVDYGWEGLQDTMAAIRNAGIAAVGAGASLTEACRPAVLDARGRRVGVLAFSCLLPTGMAATEERPGLAPLHIETAYEVDPYYQMEEPGDPSAVRIRTRVRGSDLRRALDEVQRLRPSVDVLIATVHWGFGSGEELAEYQQPLAHALIDAGVDVVHGHHPHAVHAIGFHRGKPILYSLGTFIGQQVFIPASPAVQALWAGMSPDGYVARVEIDAHGSFALRVTPTVLNVERLPEPAVGEDFQRIAGRIQRLSRTHGAEVEMRADELRVRPAGTAVQVSRPATPNPVELAPTGLTIDAA